MGGLPLFPVEFCKLYTIDLIVLIVFDHFLD